VALQAETRFAALSPIAAFVSPKKDGPDSRATAKMRRGGKAGEQRVPA
jgi:hypothetical protein